MPRERQPRAVYTINFRGTRQRVWEYAPQPPSTKNGEAPKRTAHTLLMIHGFRGTHQGMARIVQALEGYRILVPDLPGYGESEPLAHSGLAEYVDFVQFCWAHFGLGSHDALLGHSFGSIVAAHTIASWPATGVSGKPGTLVLVNPISEPALESRNALAARGAQAYYRLGAALPERLGLALLKNPAIVRVMSALMAKTRDKALRAYIHQQHAAYFSDFANRTVVLESFDASVQHDVGEVAPQVDVPTLLIVGERDDLGSAASQRALSEALPDASLHTIGAVGHLIHYETPHIAAALIDAFLAEHLTPAQENR